MELIQILILSIVQGVTEFLPVSSSGHLVITSALMQAASFDKLPDLVQVSVALHVGTLLAVVVYYRQQIIRLLTEDRRVILPLIVGTLPAAVVGLGLKKLMPGMAVLESPLTAGLMLPVTGGLLIWASRLKPGETPYEKIGYRQALIIGLFQAFAILPGISRSGATIAAGMAVGMRRESSATFAFLLAIPVIAGGGLLEALDLFNNDNPSSSPLELGLGVGTAFVVGLFSLRWLLQWIQRGRLVYFAYWCIPLGVAIVVWQLWFTT